MTATAAPPRPPVFANPSARQDVRRTLLALLASALGVLPLTELITDSSWLLDVWATMLVVIGPAALMRLRRAPSAGQIWVGLLLLIPWLTVRFLHVHAYGGIIPSRRTGHDLANLMTNLHHTTTVQAAPVHSTAAIKLALCLLLGLVAALVDLTAVVGRRGALAGVPLLVVFTVSGAVPRHPVSWWLFAVAAAGFLILLALDSSDDLHRWGHFVPRANPVTSRTAATGQRVAIIAIALAIVLPAFLPADSRNLLANLFHNAGSGDLDTGFGRGGGSSGIDPFVALKGQLNRKSPENLFDVTVRSSSGRSGAQAGANLFYARTNVLSRFTGAGWAPGDPGNTESIGSTRFESSPGEQFPPVTQLFSVHISDLGLTSNPPIFAVPTEISGLSDNTDWNPQDQLLQNSGIKPGDDYDMTVAQPAPTVALLNAASGSDPELNPWRSQPDVPQYVHTLVSRLVANAQTPYQRARAISDYFSNPANGFIYSLSTVAGDSGNALVDFLKTKTGYCQQYAAAMGVMLRLAGIPSRVVLGYTHPLPSQAGSFTVTTNDAHAWDEAYFAGVGWIPFDPTPLAGIPGGATTNLPWAPHGKQSDVGGQGVKPSGPRKSEPGGHSSSAPNVAAAAAPSDNGTSVGPLVATGLLVLLVVVVLLPWAFRQARRRRRLQRARHGDTEALWLELSDTATDLGYHWSDARTPRQVAQWLRAAAGSASQSLQQLAATVERVRYAPDAGPADGAALVADLSAVRSGLQAGRPRGERVRAALLPASLDWRLVGWLRRESGPRRKR